MQHSPWPNQQDKCYRAQQPIKFVFGILTTFFSTPLYIIIMTNLSKQCMLYNVKSCYLWQLHRNGILSNWPINANKMIMHHILRLKSPIFQIRFDKTNLGLHIKNKNIHETDYIYNFRDFK